MTRRSSIGIILFLSLILLQSPVDVRADIYLSQSDTGSLLLTNAPNDHAVKRTFELITRSETSGDIPIPDLETLEDLVSRASDKHSVPEELIYAVIHVESDGDTRARSHEGAVGLMQLMPGTARDLGVENPLDPQQNIFGGTRYLKMMLARFDGDLDRTLAAYNAGPGTVEEHGGVPPYRETVNFVRRVSREFERFKSKEEMIYTYRDDEGILHVTNIR